MIPLSPSLTLLFAPFPDFRKIDSFPKSVLIAAKKADTTENRTKLKELFNLNSRITRNTTPRIYRLHLILISTAQKMKFSIKDFSTSK